MLPNARWRSNLHVVTRRGARHRSRLLRSVRESTSTHRGNRLRIACPWAGLRELLVGLHAIGLRVIWIAIYLLHVLHLRAAEGLAVRLRVQLRSGYGRCYRRRLVGSHVRQRRTSRDSAGRVGKRLLRERGSRERGSRTHVCRTVSLLMLALSLVTSSANVVSTLIPTAASSVLRALKWILGVMGTAASCLRHSTSVRHVGDWLGVSGIVSAVTSYTATAAATTPHRSWTLWRVVRVRLHVPLLWGGVAELDWFSSARGRRETPATGSRLDSSWRW